MVVRRVVALLFSLGALGGNTHVYAQDHACEPCVGLTLLAELSSAEAAIVPSRSQSVLATANGYLLVSHLFLDRPQIAIYDSTGRFLRLYDATGGGPGELQGTPLLFDAPRDELWALDRNRLVRFDSRLRHIDTRNLGQQIFVSYLVVLSDSSFVSTMRTADPMDSVFSVTLMDTAWNAKRTVESPPTAHGLALIAPAVPEGFWTIGTNDLVMRRYTPLGEPGYTVEVESPYFTRHSSRGGPDTPPPPRHNVLYDAGNNRAVLLTRFADERWEPTPRNRMINISGRDDNTRYDSVIGLIDTMTGRTVSSQRFDEYLQPVDGAPHLVFSTRTDEDGHVVTRVYRLDLES